MIAYLEGKIIHKDSNSAIVQTNGLGYQVFLPAALHEKVEIGSDQTFFIYTKVREDELSLFGFANSEELNFFKQLISVNGVGPKTALEILSSDSNAVKNAIVQENTAFLSKIPGIGKKSAERIIVELKNKVQPSSHQEISSKLEQQLEEVTAALIGLGYQRGEIYHVLKAAPAEMTQTEDLITFFLKNI
ncbi:Holliday junction branch migration protein RuvA [Candidatus Peregrinibacteria bacterium]|nr:Holliday junction branch migration protein RuvA [Candidatus Peregrinibacteria bacterium]